MNNDLKLCGILEVIFVFIFFTKIPNPLSLLFGAIPPDPMPIFTFILITIVLLIVSIISLIIKD